jgi:hypothetical protein
VNPDSTSDEASGTVVQRGPDCGSLFCCGSLFLSGGAPLQVSVSLSHILPHPSSLQPTSITPVWDHSCTLPSLILCLFLVLYFSLYILSFFLKFSMQ